jgi:Gamma-glutamyltransferase
MYSFLLFILGCSHFDASTQSARLFKSDAMKLKDKYSFEGNEYVISTQGPFSTKAGKEMFEQGGNIFDAFAAVSFTISVERPQSTGIGGGGFLLYFTPGMKEPVAVDFREKAPLKAHQEMYMNGKEEKAGRPSIVGADSVGVPGLVAGVLEIHRKHGRLPLAKVLEPAIRLAEEGFQVYPELEFALSYKKEDLEKFPSTKKIFFRKNRPLKKGEHLVQKDLAQTLRRIAKSGKSGFYKGHVAKSLIKTTKDSWVVGYMTQKGL